MQFLCIYSSNVNFNIYKACFFKVTPLEQTTPSTFFFLNCTDLFHFHEYLDLVSEAT